VIENSEEKSITGLGSFSNGLIAMARDNNSICTKEGKVVHSTQDTCLIANDVEGDFCLIFAYDKVTGKISSDVNIDLL
jgi:hypothetical protein